MVRHREAEAKAPHHGEVEAKGITPWRNGEAKGITPWRHGELEAKGATPWRSRSETSGDQIRDLYICKENSKCRQHRPM